MRELKKVKTKDLKKGETYWLTFDYTDYGGTPVRYSKTIKTPRTLKGDVEVKDDSGEVFRIQKNSWLFAEDPLIKGETHNENQA